MIIIQFPIGKETTSLGKKFSKPRFFLGFRKIFENFYSEDCSIRYAKELESFIHKKMDYPDEGIYFVNKSDNSMRLYDVEGNKWINTGKRFEDYIIYPDSSLWKDVGNEFMYLNKFLEEIKEFVEKVTRNMFAMDNLDRISCSERTNYKLEAFEVDSRLSKVIEQYINKNKVSDYLMKIMKKIFKTTILPVFISESGKIIGAISEDKSFSMKETQDGFDAAKQFICETFEAKDANFIYAKIKNLLLYGINASYEVKGFDDGYPYTIVDGFKMNISYSTGELTPVFDSNLKKYLANEVKSVGIIAHLAGKTIKNYYFKHNNSKWLELTLPTGHNVVLDISGSTVQDHYRHVVMELDESFK